MSKVRCKKDKGGQLKNMLSNESYCFSQKTFFGRWSLQRPLGLHHIISLNLYSIGVRFDRNRPCNLFLIRCISGAKWTQIRHETDQKTEIRTNRSFTNVIFSRKENNKTKFSGRLHFRVTENILYKFMWIKTFKSKKVLRIP